MLLLLAGLQTGACVKLEMNYVTIFNDVISAFLLVLPSSLATTANKHVQILLRNRNATGMQPLHRAAHNCNINYFLAPPTVLCGKSRLDCYDPELKISHEPLYLIISGSAVTMLNPA